jgi:tetratricopeptide (TPR) repeat protein
VVAWSWELLTESERTLIERLSVFLGGASAETAGAICARGDLSEDLVADLLMSLADKSLLVVLEPTESDDGAQPRYRMLETIREFATEQLAEQGELTELRAAHARYFVQLAETAEPKLRTAEQLSWLDRLTTERENLLATLRFAVETGDADLALRLGAALSWYWTLLGRHDEAAGWLAQVVAVPGEGPPETYALVWVAYTASAAVSGTGMPESYKVERMLELVGDLDLSVSHPLLSMVEPGVLMLNNRDEEARLAVERNLSHPDPWARATLHLVSAVMAENAGDLVTMKQQIPLGLDIFREIGDRWGIGTAVGVLATMHTLAGDLEEAITAMEEARTMMAELRSSDDECHAWTRIGMLRLRLGDVAGARRAVEAARAISIQTGSLVSTAVSLNGLADIENAEGRPEEAHRLAEEARVLVLGVPFSPPQMRASIQTALATFDIATGALDAAGRHLAEAYVAVMQSHDMPIGAYLAIVTADLVRARGGAAQAAQLLGASFAIRGINDRSEPNFERIAAELRAGLGPEEFERRHRAGRDLTQPAALALIEANLPSTAFAADEEDQDESLDVG